MSIASDVEVKEIEAATAIPEAEDEEDEEDEKPAVEKKSEPTSPAKPKSSEQDQLRASLSKIEAARSDESVDEKQSEGRKDADSGEDAQVESSRVSGAPEQPEQSLESGSGKGGETHHVDESAKGEGLDPTTEAGENVAKDSTAPRAEASLEQSAKASDAGETGARAQVQDEDDLASIAKPEPGIQDPAEEEDEKERDTQDQPAGTAEEAGKSVED